MPENDPRLVPGRNCGECTVCCQALWIDEPELKKQPGVLCPNCAPGKGCTIYQTRPPICRNWHCEWRKMAMFGPEWRPDRCQILIGETSNNIPPGFKQRGLRFDLNGDARVQAFLNNHIGLTAAVADQDFERFGAFLAEAVEACLSHPRQWVDP